jgi:hypothetical protein
MLQGFEIFRKLSWFTLTKNVFITGYGLFRNDIEFDIIVYSSGVLDSMSS